MAKWSYHFHTLNSTHPQKNAHSGLDNVEFRGQNKRERQRDIGKRDLEEKYQIAIQMATNKMIGFETNQATSDHRGFLTPAASKCNENLKLFQRVLQYDHYRNATKGIGRKHARFIPTIESQWITHDISTDKCVIIEEWPVRHRSNHLNVDKSNIRQSSKWKNILESIFIIFTYKSLLSTPTPYLSGVVLQLLQLHHTTALEITKRNKWIARQDQTVSLSFKITIGSSYGSIYLYHNFCTSV